MNELILPVLQERFKELEDIRNSLARILNYEIGARLRLNRRETPDISAIMGWGEKVEKHFQLLQLLLKDAEQLFPERNGSDLT